MHTIHVQVTCLLRIQYFYLIHNTNSTGRSIDYQDPVRLDCAKDFLKKLIVKRVTTKVIAARTTETQTGRALQW